MKKGIFDMRLLVILIVLVTSLCTSCTYTSSWSTHDDQYITTDFKLAQNETPFILLLPEYLLNGDLQTRPPEISGTLKDNRSENTTHVLIHYPANLKNKDPYIRIEETNSKLILGDPTSNTDLFETLIFDTVVVYSEVNHGYGPGFVFSFNDGTVYFIVHVFNVSYSEALKIVESIVTQFR